MFEKEIELAIEIDWLELHLFEADTPAKKEKAIKNITKKYKKLRKDFKDKIFVHKMENIIELCTTCEHHCGIMRIIAIWIKQRLEAIEALETNPSVLITARDDVFNALDNPVFKIYTVKELQRLELVYTNNPEQFTNCYVIPEEPQEIPF